MRRLPSRIAPIALVALAACSSEAATKPVTADTVGVCLCGPYVTPAMAMINIGDRIQFTASGGAQYPTFRWRSSNAAVARVDSLSGLATAISLGSATIIASAVKDPTVMGAAALTVTSFGPLENVTIDSINEVATGRPANLAAVVGDVDVVASVGTVVSTLATATLVVNNGVRDTTVAAQTVATGTTGRWTLRWATAARNNGSPVFPNGQYTLKVVFPSSSATVSSTRINAIVANP